MRATPRSWSAVAARRIATAPSIAAARARLGVARPATDGRSRRMPAARGQLRSLAGRGPRASPASTATARSIWPRCWPASVPAAAARIALGGADITADGVPARAAPGHPLRDRRAAGRGHGRRLLRRDQSGAEGDRRAALLAARPQRLGSHPRPCPRADPAPRHPHAVGEDADRPALRRQHPEGAAGARAAPTPASSIFNKPTYGLDLQNIAPRP